MQDPVRSSGQAQRQLCNSQHRYLFRQLAASADSLTVRASLIAPSACSRIAPEIVLVRTDDGHDLFGQDRRAATRCRSADSLRAIVIDECCSQIDLQMSGYRQDSEISRFNRSMASTDWFDVSHRCRHGRACSARGQRAIAGCARYHGRAPGESLGHGAAGGRPHSCRMQPRSRRCPCLVGYRQLQVREHPASAAQGIAATIGGPECRCAGICGRPAGCAILALGIAQLHDRYRRRSSGAGQECAGGVVADRRSSVRSMRSPSRTPSCNSTTWRSPPPGEYRHYIVRDGHRYSHTIDPRTGRPVEHALASVVVVSARLSRPMHGPLH